MRITPFEPSTDFAHLLTWFQNPEIMKGMGMPVMDAQQLTVWINDGKIILIALDDAGKTVGMINFYNYKTHRPQVEVGYLIDPQHQGQGLATQLLGMGIAYLRLHHPDISEITETYVEEFNQASRRVLDKNGFEMYEYRPEKQRYYYRLTLK